jgi:hypothetical protein
MLGASHGFGTKNLVLACYDNSSPAKAIQPANWTVNSSTFDVAVSFASAQTGYCVLNGSGGSSGGGTGDIASAPAGNQSITQPAGTDLTIPRQNTTRNCVGTLAGLQACHDDLPSSGGTMKLPQGTISACGINITKNNVHIEGTGMESTILQCTTASSPVLTITGTQAYLENFTVQHATNQPTCAGGAGSSTCGEGIQFASGDRHEVRHVKVKSSYNGFYLDSLSLGVIMDVLSERNLNHGFLFDISNTTMQWNLKLVHSQQNGGDGFHMQNPVASNQATCGSFDNTTAFGNNGYGFFIQTTGASSGIGDCQFTNIISSTNNNDGFFLDFGTSGARSHQFTNIFSEQNGTSAFTGVTYGTTISPSTGAASNVGYGMNFASCDATPPSQVNGGVMWNNAFSGIYAGCTRMSINSVSTHGNGRAGSASEFQRAGITIRASGVSVVGGQHDGDTACAAGATCEKDGVEISNSADKPSISNLVCHTTLTNCVLPSTQPTNGFQVREGSSIHYYNTGAASGACNNGDEYHRVDAGNSLAPLLALASRTSPAALRQLPARRSLRATARRSHLRLAQPRTWATA